MKANEKQVGGNHYQNQYQHWDWVGDNKLSYLEGCATKYIVRWRDKGGVQDLEKAVHYIEKLIEPNANTLWSSAVASITTVNHISSSNCRCVVTPTSNDNSSAWRIQSTLNFLEQYKAITAAEILIIQNLVCSSKIGHQEKALEKLLIFIEFIKTEKK